MGEILENTWHEFPAITLENELLRVVMVPELGAKIVSFFDKAHQHEWIVPPMRRLRHTTYGADFVSQDMSGWDEMMPTIVSCSVDGVRYPDHGEVWSLPWKVEKATGEVILAVAGVAWPYSFSRSAKLIAPDCLELGYTIKNNGGSAFPYLWAAHPQFAVDGSVRILLPPEVTCLVNVIEDDPAWGAAGKCCAWPEAKDGDGRMWSLDRVRSADNRACRKFYLPPDQSIGWAALVHEERKCQLRLSWSPEDLPYFGLWVDEGAYNTLPVAAPEPCNGYYDSLERAIRNARVTILEPGMEKHWKLRVQFGAMEQ